MNSPTLKGITHQTEEEHLFVGAQGGLRIKIGRRSTLRCNRRGSTQVFDKLCGNPGVRDDICKLTT